MARTTTPASEMLLDSEMLRSSPVQARSNARLVALLDAAAAVIDKSGYETLTTAAVANQAGASIGTVYRYFEDRIVLLNALALRNYERTANAFLAVIEKKPSNIRTMINDLFEANLALFRTEPGYRSLRIGDVLDIRPRETLSASRRAVDFLVPLMAEQYGISKNEETAAELEAAYIMIDALCARAFLLVKDGEEKFISKARMVADRLAERLEVKN
jgi:AcrR family transcriptional regulator